MIALTHYKTASTETAELLDDISFPQRVNWFPETYAKTKSGVMYPPHILANKVLDQQLLELLRNTPSKKTAFILAAGNAHFAGLARETTESRLKYKYKILPMTLTQVFAGRVAQMCGATDHIVTDSSACTSSLKAMMDVQTLIKFYGFTRVVVLGVEDAVSSLVVEFFGESKAVLSAKEDEEGILPSAFDSKNGKFHVGQGAVFAVFESEEGLKTSGFTPIARLLGAYTASEPCANALGQLESGEGYVKAGQGAIEMAGLRNHQVSTVKTHGTGTISNNMAECNALHKLLPDGFIATSYKPTIGHTMGASGLLESTLLIDDLRSTGLIPAIKNRTESDDVFLSEPAPPMNNRFLSLAAGMGNVYSAAVFSVE